MQQPTLKPIILALGLTAVCYEVGLRIPSLARLAPKPKPFYDAGVTDRIAKLESLVTARGSVEVLAVGSSVVRTNIDPRAIMEVWARQGSSSTIFNAGLSALQPSEVVFMTENLLLPMVKPKIVVQFVRGEEAVSPVTVENSTTLSKGRIERSWKANRLLGDTVRWITQKSKLVEYYGALSNALAVPVKPLNGLTFPTDEHGFGATKFGLSDTRLLAPRLLEQPECNTHLGMRGPYPTLESALKKAKSLSARYHITWVIVPMPEHPAKWKEPAAYADFLRVLEDLVRVNGLEYTNPFGSDLYALTDEKWWSDYHHMSPVGAAYFSRIVASSLRSHN